MEKPVKRLLLLGLAFTLWSCDPGPGGSSGADDYKFETKEYTLDTITVTVKVFANQTELDHAARDLNVRVQGLQAFGKLYPSENRCVIYVLDPEYKYAPEFIGHEFAHCVWGRWHPARDAREHAQGLRNIK